MFRVSSHGSANNRQSKPEACGRWFARLMAQVDTLEAMPQRYGLAAEAEDLGREIRELHVGRRQGMYRLIFEIRGPVVYILRVWHSARDAVSCEVLYTSFPPDFYVAGYLGP